MADAQRIDPQALRRWPLPSLAGDADKEARGRIVVIAGSREMPGAAVLAATAALRVGAGKLVIATARSVAAQMAFSMPEARVIASRCPKRPAAASRRRRARSCWGSAFALRTRW
jgi:ADP-dependent NAD(P)H-hydrate dehydratase